MENQEFSVEVTHHNLDDDPGNIANSLRYSSKKCRREILRSHGYHALWLGEINADRYAELLASHYWIHKEMEEAFSQIGDNFVVANQFFDHEKVFAAKPFTVVSESKSTVLFDDYLLLTKSPAHQEIPSVLAKAQLLIDYILKIKNQYSVALLGIAYMLEETRCYAGPRIGIALDKKLNLGGQAISYLLGNGNEKQRLWQFRRSLNSITDFQTQANIVIASTLSYRMYRDLLDPYVSSMPINSSQYHA